MVAGEFGELSSSTTETALRRTSRANLLFDVAMQLDSFGLIIEFIGQRVWGTLIPEILWRRDGRGRREFSLVQRYSSCPDNFTGPGCSNPGAAYPLLSQW